MHASPAIPHGFTHASDWSWAAIRCASCGYSELWQDLRDSSGKPPRTKAVRAAICRDLRAVLHSRGCKHV